MDQLVPVLDYDYIYRMPEVFIIHLIGQGIDAALFTWLMLNFFPGRSGRGRGSHSDLAHVILLICAFTAFLFTEDILCRHNYYAYTLAMILPPLLLSAIFLEGKFWLKAIVCLDFFATMSSMEIVVENLWRLLSTDYMLDRGLFVLLFFVNRILLKAVLLVHIRLLMLNIREKYDRKADSYWAATGAVSCLSYLIGVYVLYAGAHDARTLGYDEIFALIGAVLPIFSSYLLSLLLRDSEHSKALLARELVIRAQKENLENQEMLLADTRKFRHDYKAHMLTMQALMERQEWPQLKHYMERLSDSLNTHTAMIHFTGYDTIDLILNQKSRRAAAAGVDFTVYADFETYSTAENFGKIDLFDLNALLSNLCDNAVEAAAKTERGYVRITFSRQKAYLKIVCENSTVDNVLCANPEFHTSKADSASHGYGMKIIRDIVSSYEGMFFPEATDTSLTISVLLPVAQGRSAL